MDQLPDTWTIAEIEHLLVPLDNGKCLQQGWSPQCDSEPARSGDWGVLKTTAIQDGVFLTEHNKRLPIHLEPRQNIEVRVKDILMTCAGPRSRCGVVCLVRHEVSHLMMSGKMYRFRADESLASPEYLELFLRSRDAQAAIDRMKTGINDSGLNLTHDRFKKLGVPLAPLAEQHRIVAKIEELFSELDQGVASLKTAREQLKVYRQSLLKNAFEGKLTATWRAEHRDQIEPATALQQRIAQEREARYQQQLADWQSQGKPGPKPKPPKPLPPLTPEELAELLELPAGWGWVSLNQISDSISDGDHQAPPQTAEGVPFITISDIKNQQVDFSDTRFVSQAYFDALSGLRRPQRGDVLYSVTGSFGIPCLVDFDRDFCFQRHIALVRAGQHVSKKYLFYVLSSRFSYSQAAAVATGTAQKTVPLSGLRTMKIPFMSSREQEQIAQELESKLSEADQLDQTLATALQQADALRQSILKKAFCGQLVKQDKNDEPATALLERIRVERSSLSTTRRSRRAITEAPKALELTPPPGKIIPFPVAVPGIAAKDLHAGILAMAYRLHALHPDKLPYFGHVKAEKISHLVEAHLGLDLERQPFKDAAGPNDHPHLKKVEHRARKANWFEVTRLETGRYEFRPQSGFGRLLTKTQQALGGRLGEVERLLELMLPMNMRQAEILATVYAAWNNLLLLGKSPSDDEIVLEARENWHEAKLKIDRSKFFRALEWMREKGLVPVGRGRVVAAKGE